MSIYCSGMMLILINWSYILYLYFLLYLVLYFKIIQMSYFSSNPSSSSFQSLMTMILSWINLYCYGCKNDHIATPEVPPFLSRSTQPSNCKMESSLHPHLWISHWFGFMDSLLFKCLLSIEIVPYLAFLKWLYFSYESPIMYVFCFLEWQDISYLFCLCSALTLESAAFLRSPDFSLRNDIRNKSRV